MSELGFSILEVIIAGTILAVTILGLALMFARGQGFVVGASDQRTALYLAEQMIERQIGQLKSGAKPTDITLVCVNTTATPPQCSSFSTTQHSLTETLSGTASAGSSVTEAANPLTYTRFTCVQWVNDSTLQHGTDGTPATDCPCTSAGTQSNTKRVCVKVTPTNPQASVVVLRTVLAGQPP